MNIKRLLLIPATLLAAAAFSPANALTIQLYDGTTTLTVTDNGAGDLDPSAGGLLSFTSLGTWIVNLQFATSNAPGEPTISKLHLTSTLASRGAGFLEMTVWDTFTSPLQAGTLTYSSAGNGFGPATVSGYGKKIDRAETVVQTAPCSYEVPVGASGSCAKSINHDDLTGAYVMTLFQRIDVAGAIGPLSLDSSVFNVPEPGSLALLGLGLVGLGLGARRRAR